MSFVPEIEKAILEAAKVKGTGLAKRSQEYITCKINEGKAVIAVSPEGEFAGFCYIESWGHEKFVANSGLIVPEKFRGNLSEAQLESESAQLVEAATVHEEGVPVATRLPKDGIDLKDHLSQLEFSLIKQALDEADGVVAHAAKRLSMRRTTLVEKMRKYGLQRQEHVSGI